MAMHYVVRIAILLGTCGLWAADPPDMNLHLSKARQLQSKGDFVRAETEFKLALSVARKESEQKMAWLRLLKQSDLFTTKLEISPKRIDVSRACTRCGRLD